MADNVVDMLAIEIEANAMQSVDGVKKLSRALTSLAKSVSKVNSAGINNVSASLKVMNTATGTAAQNMDKSSKGTKKFGTSLGLMNGSMKRSNSGMKSLAYHFGKFYANCLLAIRGAKAFGSAIGSTMDYIEAFNFFDVATNSATARTGEWKELGYSSAEEYAKAFEQGLSNLNEKMTGFKVDVQTGDFDVSNMANLGINLTDLTTFEAEITSITSSLGLCTKTSYNTSKALSMLSADMSSLHNIDLSTVMTNFQSGLIGQSRALYKYGIDITNATLQTYAYANGIAKSVSEMTQAEKMQLRMLAILDQSKNSWGDLANTINQPANQLRVLKNGFKNLAITIGKLFMPIVSAILPYLNAMVKSLQYLFTWLAKVAGVDLKVENSGSGVSSAVDDMEDLEDSTNDANTAAKKLQNTIYGFDEINKRDSDSSSNASSGGGGGTGIDLSDAISSALAEYEAAWEAAYANMQDKSTKMANAIVKAFQDGDYEAIGTYVSTGLTRALNGIKWKKIYEVAKGFGKGFASFLNGLITPSLFSALGTTIAGAINTAIAASKSFAEKFNFTNLGTSFGAGVNSCLKNINWSDALKSSKAWGAGIGNTLNGFLHETDFTLLGSTVANAVMVGVNGWYSFVKTFNFSQLGQKIGDAINGFFNTMSYKTYDARFDDQPMTGWQRLGTSIGKSMSGMADAIVKAFDTIDWKKVKQGFKELLESALDNININVGKVTIAIGSFVLAKGALSLIGTAIKTAILGKLTAAFTGAGTAATTGAGGAAIAGSASKAASLFGKTFVLGAAAYIAMKLADKIGQLITGDSSWTTGGALEKGIKSIPGSIKNFFTGKDDKSLKGWWSSFTELNGLEDVETRFKKLKKNITGFFAPLSVSVKAKEDQASTATVYAGIKKTLGKPYSTYIKDNSNKSATTLYDGMQKVLSGKSLVVASKTNTSGWSILQGLQNGILGNRGFGSGLLSTGAKVTNSGYSLFSGMQNGTDGRKGFKDSLFATSAKVTNSGYSLFSGMQNGTDGRKGFKDSLFSTRAKVTNSGYSVFSGMQTQFSAKNLSTGVDVPSGADAFNTFNDQWNANKKNLQILAELDVSAKSDSSIPSATPLKDLLVKFPQYAKGGFPSQGDLFIANENGAELVGGMNGKTTVANQNEIADGFAAAIYPSMYSAVKNAMSGSGNNNHPIVVENTIMADTEVLYQKTEQGRKKSERRYGTTVSLA